MKLAPTVFGFMANSSIHLFHFALYSNFISCVDSMVGTGSLLWDRMRQCLYNPICDEGPLLMLMGVTPSHDVLIHTF